MDATGRGQNPEKSDKRNAHCSDCTDADSEMTLLSKRTGHLDSSWGHSVMAESAEFSLSIGRASLIMVGPVLLEKTLFFWLLGPSIHGYDQKLGFTKKPLAALGNMQARLFFKFS